MARITVEDCLHAIPNRFALVMVAARRARQLAKGAQPLVNCDNRPCVTALREIASSKVRIAGGLNEAIGAYVSEVGDLPLNLD